MILQCKNEDILAYRDDTATVLHKGRDQRLKCRSLQFIKYCSLQEWFLNISEHQNHLCCLLNISESHLQILCFIRSEMGIENLHCCSSSHLMCYTIWETLHWITVASEVRKHEYRPLQILAWGKPFRGHVPAALHNEQRIRPPSCLKTRASRWPFWPFKFKCFKTDPPTFQGPRDLSACFVCVCLC